MQIQLAPDGNVHIWGGVRAKLYKMLGFIEVVKSYINNILVLGKDSFHKHIEYFRVIFDMLLNILL